MSNISLTSIVICVDVGFSFPAKPDVYMFTKNAKSKMDIELTCLATGFSSVHTTMSIKRNGRILSIEDGVQTTGVRPNGDGTYQRRDHVQILKSDMSKYTCEVIHVPSSLHIEQLWGKKPFFFLFFTF